jgi:hypothetical protein
VHMELVCGTRACGAWGATAAGCSHKRWVCQQKVPMCYAAVRAE